jgi:hypothetical protein
MRTLVVNSVITDGKNNKLIYKFPNSVVFKDAYVAVASISMYYSWFNISAALGNNTLQYYWQGGSGLATLTTVTFPDGLYEISTLNDYLQFHFVQKNRYLINAGQNVYFIELTVNPTQYVVQINTFVVPTSAILPNIAPAGGFNNDATLGVVGFPTTAFNPQVSIPTLPSFGNIIGFAAGTGGAPLASVLGTITLSYLSTSAPQVQPNYSLLLTSSVVDNPYSTPESVIYGITPTVAIGNIIAEKPPQFMWNKLRDGTYNELRLAFLGTNLGDIALQDPSITVILAIANADEVKSR